MAFQRTRWRLRESIRTMMLGTAPSHPLRRAYLALRGLPFVSAAWRALGSNEAWRDVALYAARGGTFAGAAAAPSGAQIPEFGSEAYFKALIGRILFRSDMPEAIADRILIVNNGLSAGGAERQIVYTLKGLKARGYDARFMGELLGRAPGLDFHQETLVRAGIAIEEVHRAAGPGPGLYAGVARPVAEALAAAPIDFMLEVLDMAAAMRRLNPQIVHLWQDETATKYGLSALIAGIPRIVLSGRNLNPTHFVFHQPYMHGAYRALLEAPGVRLSNNTRAGALSYADWLGVQPDRIRVILNGFDACAFQRPAAGARATTRARYGIADDARLILGVFRLSAEKRPDLWIGAAAKALQKRPGLRFLIAGTGPLLTELQALVDAEGLEGKVLLIGECAAIGDLFAAADLFFLASSEEGAPNVLIEAQSSGLASVVTDAGGIAETVQDGETATIVRTATPAALAEAVIAALEDISFIEKARKSGPALVAERFGINRMIDDTLAAYALDA